MPKIASKIAYPTIYISLAAFCKEMTKYSLKSALNVKPSEKLIYYTLSTLNLSLTLWDDVSRDVAIVIQSDVFKFLIAAK